MRYAPLPGESNPVDEATDVSSGEFVTLFRMPRPRSRTELDSLLASLESWRCLNHPNLELLRDVVNVDGEIYAVSEARKGITLQTFLDRPLERMSPKEVEVLVESLVAGLAHAHRNGVLHGALHPAQVLLDGGQARLLAFTSEQLRLRSGSQVGQPSYQRYLPPEVIRAEKKTPATDVYGVGALLRSLFTRRPTGEEPFDLQIPDGFPTAISGVIAQSLAANPENRYPSVKEMLRAVFPDPAARLSKLDRAEQLHLQALEAIENSRNEEARKSWAAAMLQAPGDAAFASNLGVALLHLKRPSEALEAFEKAMETTRPYAAAGLNLAWLQIDLNLFERARETLRDVGERLRGSERHSELLMLAKLSEPGEALLYYQRALEHNPDSRLAYEGLVVASSLLGQAKEASEYGEEARKLPLEKEYSPIIITKREGQLDSLPPGLFDGESDEGEGKIPPRRPPPRNPSFGEANRLPKSQGEDVPDGT